MSEVAVIPAKIVVVLDDLDASALAEAAKAVDESYDDEDNPRVGDFDFTAEIAVRTYLSHMAVRQKADA